MLNQCNFIGRLGQAPEIRYTQSGTAVATFSIACSEKWKDKEGNKQEKTEWIRCVAWRGLAEVCGQYLEKGQLVYVSGSMTTRKWQNQDGKDQYATEIILKDMKMLGGKSEGHAGGGHQEPQDNYGGGGGTGEDVPF